MPRLFALLLALLGPSAPDNHPTTPFAIKVIDADTGRGVPLVELTTVNHVKYVTDSAGLVAFNEPGLMNTRVFFHVKSPGYEFPADGFGIRGKALDITPSGSAQLKIKRLNIAERLYRVTGQGIYRDTVLLRQKPPIQKPVLNALVTGQDSVQTIVHNGQILWFWGDTNWPAYPLGNFNSPGAVSQLPDNGGLDPSLGIDLTYFLDEKTGFARPTAKMPGEGPTWIGSLTHLPDPNVPTRTRLHASYAKVKPGPSMEAYERGIITWNDDQNLFEKTVVFPAVNPTLHPLGHAFKLDDPDGTPYVYFANPYPHTRVKANFADFSNPESYEAFTCLEPGSTLKEPRIDRTPEGRVIYSWKPNTPALDFNTQSKLLKSNALEPHEALLTLRDFETGDPVQAHGSSISWNSHRNSWVMTFVQAYGGPSFLGEVWFAEAQAPEGPWTYARKIATHPNYSFYNPRHHPFFDQQDGRLIYFEGTYVTTFSGNDHPTPWYDYNQLMYRLDLDDPRLNLPTPARPDPANPGKIPFFTLPRPAERSLPLSLAPDGTFSLDPNAENCQPLGHVLPPDTHPAPPSTVALYKTLNSSTKIEYLTTTKPTELAIPYCLAWENPAPLTLPRKNPRP